jgi:hypothetical protein
MSRLLQIEVALELAVALTGTTAAVGTQSDRPATGHKAT